MHSIEDASRHRLRLLMLAGFIVACAVFGGSSRTDNLAMLIVRLLSVFYMMLALLLPGRRYWQGLGWPLLLLGAFGATMAIQLAPLPPVIWAALAGHGRFVEAAAAAGLPQPWRPISLSPDLTINSILALLVPLAVLIGTATLAPPARRQIIPVMLVTMIASAVLGIAQWAGGTSSSLYIYRYTSRDLPVGLFANRNHQAVFLAMALPLLRLWAVLPSKVVQRDATRAWLAGAAASLLIPVILATGSRSGLVLALAGAVAGFLFAPPNWRALARPVLSSRRRLVLAGAAVSSVLLAVASVFMLGRAVSVTRLMEMGQVEADLRIRFLPIVLQMTREFLPIGSGLGTFEKLFHVYEPVWALKRTNFNHAHNDLIELAMTGGVAALLVLLAYVGFLVIRARAILKWGSRRSASMVAASGIVLVLMLFAASLTDYPLRTPAMSMMIALATSLLAMPLARTQTEVSDR